MSEFDKLGKLLAAKYLIEAKIKLNMTKKPYSRKQELELAETKGQFSGVGIDMIKDVEKLTLRDL